MGQFDDGRYGERRQRSGTVLPERGYAGMFRHADSGLYLTHYRAYSPIHGRWLSRDPIGELGGINLYAYVGGNPLRYTDPLGLWKNPSDIYDDAMNDARNSGLPGPHNGLQDAYRHCLASCEMARENGAPAAQLSRPEFLGGCLV
ncbi:MAG: RHS repeat-associated core domain-containing protein [Pseudomonadota bacterium]